MGATRRRVQQRETDARSLRQHVDGDPLNASAVGTPRPERLARADPPLYLPASAAIARQRARQVGRAAPRSRDRAAVGSAPALLGRRPRGNFKRESAPAVEAADVPDVVELLQGLDRIRLMARGATGNSPRTGGDLHVGLVKQWWRIRGGPSSA